jgi:RNA polymerase sigma factor (sigma-70 family)
MGTGAGDDELAPAVLEAFHRGEDDAVRAVYDRYRGPVYAVALATLGDHHLAVEAAQETFVRAWRAIDRYEPNRNLAPWLFTIARRTAVDTYRAHRRVSAQPLDDETLVAPPLQLDTIWETYQVRAAVDRLEPDERAVVRLQHFEQLSHSEIADRLGIPIGTVKSRSFRAHRRLADWLRPLRALTGSEPIGPPAAYAHHGDPRRQRDAI